jgi:hypothetical protein
MHADHLPLPSFPASWADTPPRAHRSPFPNLSRFLPWGRYSSSHQGGRKGGGIWFRYACVPWEQDEVELVIELELRQYSHEPRVKVREHSQSPAAPSELVQKGLHIWVDGLECRGGVRIVSRATLHEQQGNSQQTLSRVRAVSLCTCHVGEWCVYPFYRQRLLSGITENYFKAMAQRTQAAPDAKCWYTSEKHVSKDGAQAASGPKTRATTSLHHCSSRCQISSLLSCALVE